MRVSKSISVIAVWLAAGLFCSTTFGRTASIEPVMNQPKAVYRLQLAGDTDAQAPNVTVFPDRLQLANGKSLDLPTKQTQVLASGKHIVLAQNSNDRYRPGLTLSWFDATGVKRREKTYSFGASASVSSTGIAVITDNVEGVGEFIHVVDASGEALNKVKPFEAGYSVALVENSRDFIIVLALPDEPFPQQGKVIVLTPDSGKLVREFPLPLHNPTKLVSMDNTLAIHDEWVDPETSNFHSDLLIVDTAGSLIRSLQEYAHQIALDTERSQILIAGKQSLKAMNYLTANLAWEVLYTNLYQRKKLNKPQDIPAGFDLYPLQLILFPEKQLLALSLGQSSVNPNHPKYDTELYLLDLQSGERLTDMYLGQRNAHLSLTPHRDGFDVADDKGMSSYRIDTK